MDNFDRPKKRPNSIDGFISSDKPRFSHSEELRELNLYHQPRRVDNSQTRQNAPDSIDAFRRPEGFTPFDQPQILRPGARNNPNEVTLPFERQATESPHTAAEPKKRRLFRKKKDRHLIAKRSKLKTSLRIGGVMALMLVLIGGGLTLKAFLKRGNIFKGGGNSVILNNQDVDPAELKGEGDGRVNILLLGKGGEEQNDGPDLTDTIIIASIDPIAKEAVLLSVPRDLWIESPSGYDSKVNEVYANAKYAVLDNYPLKQRTSSQVVEQAEKAGMDVLKKTLSESLGIPLHYYSMIDFAGFRKAIDTVGGVDINVTEELNDASMAWENNGNPVIAKIGQQNFDGRRALMYARSRKTSARGDFSRAERQRQVLLALKDKVLTAGTLANPIKLNQLIDDFGNHVATDFSINEIVRVYELMKEIDSKKVASVGLDDYVSGSTINNLSVQIPKAGISDFSAIQNYVRNIMKDAFLKSEDAKIIILNGTDTAGLATRKSVELKSYGYNVISVGDAPTKTYTATTLVDLRNGDKKYTLNYLEKRLNVQATTQLPDANINAGTADFVIILGSNETNSQN
ncbi:LCP family protein [Candidatus Saccharibacteria bacterium]|nr:LCP family protein [Candidatus Saccharibacteria bacterium]